ncbi:MAG: HD domain-containing protein [Candidatus Nanoarchaeia archaeon]|nr:HD domain-containing protein [Candidatus Nanoarchaeia archaeon]MDD5239252.1 HD domain-containing protein [Candidatus Nanoarchaeia archaeon]
MKIPTAGRNPRDFSTGIGRSPKGFSNEFKLPNREQAIALLEKYRILPNILAHSMQVNRVAVFLAKKLVKSGEKVNLNVVDMASLLHDIAKSRTIIEKRRDIHWVEAEEILTEEGYPELGHICKMHGFSELNKSKNPSWEAKIVCYADSRVMHDRIVTLQERMEDLKKRYKLGDDEPHLVIWKNLETEIFSKLKIKPNDVKKLVENEQS